MGSDLVRRLTRAARTAAALGALAAATPGAARAQSAPPEPDSTRVRGTLFERLNLDRLRFSAIGAAMGAVTPSKAEPTTSYTVMADYGEITPRWRVLFTATFWNSRMRRRYTDILTDTLRNSITDPTNDYTLDLGRVRLSDIALLAETQYSRWTWAGFRPYVGGGIGAHVVNAEGRAINGTIVEQALDNITTGVAATAGLDLTLAHRITLGGQARFDLLSAARYASLRVGGSYVFAVPRRPPRR